MVKRGAGANPCQCQRSKQHSRSLVERRSCAHAGEVRVETKRGRGLEGERAWSARVGEREREVRREPCRCVRGQCVREGIPGAEKGRCESCTRPAVRERRVVGRPCHGERKL